MVTALEVLSSKSSRKGLSIKSDRKGVSEESEHLAEIGRALRDKTRRGILRLLEERKEMTPGEIMEEFDLAQPTISRHLAVLKKAGLVVDRRSGQNMIYKLIEGGLRDFCTRQRRAVSKLFKTMRVDA